MSNADSVLQLLGQLVLKTPLLRVSSTPRGRSLTASLPLSAGQHLFSSPPLVAHPRAKQSPPLRLDRVCMQCFAPSTAASVRDCQPCRMDKLLMHSLKQHHKQVRTTATSSATPSLTHSPSSSPSSSSTEASRYEPMVNKLAFRLCRELRDGYENTNYLLNLLACPDMPPSLTHSLTDQLELLRTQLTELGMKEQADSFLTLEWYSRALGVLHLNTIGTPIGSALYDDISFINHSCTPSVGLIFEGMRATVVCLRDIKANEELFINYVELDAEKGNWSHEKVQETLKHNYGFDCSTTCSCGKIQC